MEHRPGVEMLEIVETKQAQPLFELVLHRYYV